MSKKTRKKSSKPAPKSRKTPARKIAAAKTARSAASKSTRTTAKKAAVKPPTKASSRPAATAKAERKPEKPVAKATGKAASARPTAPSHQPTPKKLIKSNPSPSPAAVAGTVLVEGSVAPAFNLPRDGGGHVALADYAGQKLVLFFYPRADTPGCTREAIDFTRLKSEFAEAGAEVLGVSADSVKAQDSFSAKHQLSVPLISDERHEMLEAYGAWGEKSMYGRSFMGIIRTTVLIGDDGRVARIWRNVRVDGHAEEVLAAVRAL